PASLPCQHIANPGEPTDQGERSDTQAAQRYRDERRSVRTVQGHYDLAVEQILQGDAQAKDQQPQQQCQRGQAPDDGQQAVAGHGSATFANASSDVSPSASFSASSTSASSTSRNTAASSLSKIVFHSCKPPCSRFNLRISASASAVWPSR